MNANFISRTLTGCFFAMLLASCESHEQKADDAFERVKKEKMVLKDSNVISKNTIQEPKKTTLVKEDENPDGWAKFKLETEKKMLMNDNKIKEIKGIPNASAKLLKKATRLEKDNNDLRKQMDEYKEEVKVNLEKFKMKMNHNVNEISIELKDITTNSKK